jgi:DNA (cytosine-5)-methyltransferase 1
MDAALDTGTSERGAQPRVSGVDLFCGVGGLSAGLQKSGILISAGIDVDPACAYPFETNIEAPFLQRDVASVTGEQLDDLWIPGTTRLLAGCAPCQPFSPYRRGADTSSDPKWPLLDEFSRLVIETSPELVTMENVPRIGASKVFLDFVHQLRSSGYSVDYQSCYGPRFGLPQHRRRLVLIASRLGDIKVPAGQLDKSSYTTVRDAIGDLPPIASGETSQLDPLHTSRALSELNLRRIRASSPGGTWEEWPDELRAPCHRRASGATFRNVYARMSWDEPSPTITTLATNFGAGRFGHPEQDRPISLREAAILQGFERDYVFVRPGQHPQLAPVTRLIGNAVPPPLGYAIGETLMNHLKFALSDN